MEQKAITAKLISACFAAVLSFGLNTDTQASAKDRTPSGYQPCVEMVTSQPPTQKSRPAEPGRLPHISIDPDNKSLFKPMTREEVKVLISVLQPAKLEDGSGYKLTSRRMGAKLSAERAGVLMQDIVAELTRIHLADTLKTLRGTPDANKAAIVWGQQVAMALDLCGEMRYVDFGGDIALEQVQAIVLENREILEKLILESKLPGGDPLPGVP